MIIAEIQQFIIKVFNIDGNARQIYLWLRFAFLTHFKMAQCKRLSIRLYIFCMFVIR